MIKVSVIVPVYNGEKHLRQCLDSIVKQTLTDIEIICVDDGSTDSSLDILNEYKAKDSRFQIYTQQNLYAGVARNTGKSHATGEYLAFWDCDDYFDLTALEKLYAKAVETSADVVVCGGNQYFESQQKEYPCPPYLKVKRTLNGEVFNRYTNPLYYLAFANAAPWNKLYRRAYIEELGLDFQAVRNGNDVFFVMCAIGLADKIATVNEKLVTYRVNADSGLVATLSKSPTTPIEAWIAIEEKLSAHDGFGVRSFANKALGSMIYMLQNISEYEAFKTAVQALKEYGLEKLHIMPHEDEPDYYFERFYRAVVQHIWNDSVEDFAVFFAHAVYLQKSEAFAQKRGVSAEFTETKRTLKETKRSLAKMTRAMRKAQSETKKLEKEYKLKVKDLEERLAAKEQVRQSLSDELTKTKKELDATRGSWSYRVGHKIVSVPGKIKRMTKVAPKKVETSSQNASLAVAPKAVEAKPAAPAKKASAPKPAKDKKLKVLLLTNRDSDNVGDQFIEACSISLVKTIMKNLGFSSEQYTVSSRAAAIVNKEYVKKKNPDLLRTAEKAISGADLVIFGGAPMFNWRYQIFYERTATTLEIANKYNVPVIFSAIGVEGYDPEDKRCQRLRSTLELPCVKQITTRDGYDELVEYVEGLDIPIAKVSDSAVFSREVFANLIKERPERELKKVGIFVLRSNGFVDNGVDLTRDDAAKLWVELSQLLVDNDYDYEFLTSGHFGDEAFLDRLIRSHGVPAKKCVFGINNPEALAEKLSSYDVVLSTRLHPSIISYSFGVPALGLVWNEKVSRFYESIGYADHIIRVQDATPENILNKLDEIVGMEVYRDPEYLMTVYNTLFEAVKDSFDTANKNAQPYTFEEFKENVIPFEGTSVKEKGLKSERKFRRTYEKYNNQQDIIIRNREKIELQSEKIDKLRQKIADGGNK